MFLVILAFVTVTSRPAAPVVGDHITLEFAAPATLDPSAQYEVVSRQGRRIIVRTFAPRPFMLSGTVGDVRFTNLVIPVRSVLKENDDLTPAPLAPPLKPEYPDTPFLAIGIAALCALAAWAALWFFSRRVAGLVALPALTPEERYRRAVLALRSERDRPLRWAILADETRLFLAATRPRLGKELTTTELVPRLADQERVVIDILRQGDLEKFSDRGALPRDFDDIASRALDLATPPPEGPLSIEASA